MTNLEAGMPAPDFTLPSTTSGEFRLSSLQGQYVVLYFYPKDDTSGCTVEAIEFTRAKKDFADLNCQIYGISPDPIKKHEKFIQKHELDIPLISDEEKTTLVAYGVWVEKSMYGRKYMGVERTTLLINPGGVIDTVWKKVKVNGHVDEVLDRLKEVTSN